MDEDLKELFQDLGEFMLKNIEIPGAEELLAQLANYRAQKIAEEMAHYNERWLEEAEAENVCDLMP